MNADTIVAIIALSLAAIGFTPLALMAIYKTKPSTYTVASPLTPTQFQYWYAQDEQTIRDSSLPKEEKRKLIEIKRRYKK